MSASTTNTAAIAASGKPAIEVSPAAFQALWDQSIDWLVHHYVQIGIALVAAALLIGAMLGLRALGNRLCRRHGSLTHWPATIGRVIAQTRLWFMVSFAAKLVDGYADPPAMVAQTIDVAFTICAAIQGALWAREAVIGIVEHRAGDTDHGALGSAMGIIRLLVTVVLFAIAGVSILDNLGVNVTGLIAGLGIGGIAIGLAAKGIFDDLFSALSIIFDRPFRRGDSIRWDNTSGTVEAIGLKTTRIRAVSGEEVVMNNTSLLGKELHNLARLSRRRIVMTVGVGYYTPPEVCAGIPEMIRGIVEAEDKCVLVRCGMRGFGASSLDFEVQFDVKSDVYDEVFNAQHAVCVGILAAFAGAGIDFAWPTQVAIPAGPDGRPMEATRIATVADGHGMRPAAARADTSPLPAGDATTRAEVAPD